MSLLNEYHCVLYKLVLKKSSFLAKRVGETEKRAAEFHVHKLKSLRIASAKIQNEENDVGNGKDGEDEEETAEAEDMIRQSFDKINSDNCSELVKYALKNFGASYV